jgi:hypothetical protein
MENITPTFNAASSGLSGESGAVTSTPNPTGPQTPGTAAEAPTASIHSAEFHGAAAPQASEPAPAVAPTQFEPSQAFTAERANAELDMLERGRAKPSAQKNLTPRPQLKKIVDSEIERKREARISALKAYMQFKRNEATYGAGLNHGLALDLAH